MPGKDYIKKEIIGPERICALNSCKKQFTARRQDQRYHHRNCAEADWRAKHPRKRVQKPPSWNAIPQYEARTRRDTPKLWARYMERNPIMFEHVTGKPFTPKALAEAARGIA